MHKLKIAVVGAGLIGQRHVGLIQASDQCELAAICDSNPAAETVVQANVPFYQDLNKMLAAETLDGAVIASPTNLHAPHGIACAEHGVHILVEKPITGTLTDAELLIKAAAQHGVALLVGHHRRHNPLVQQARQIVQSGQIGELVGVTAVFALLKPNDYYNVNWRTQPGGGPILTNLIHDIDNLRFICGDIEQVQAATSSKTRGFAVEDTASVIVQFANGSLGSIFVSDATPAPWSYELTSGENPAYPQTKQDCYRFLGTRGSLTFPSMALWHYPDPQAQGWWEQIEQQPIATSSADALTAQLNHFCRVILGEERPLIPGEEGLRTLQIIHAIIQSAQQKRSTN